MRIWRLTKPTTLPGAFAVRKLEWPVEEDDVHLGREALGEAGLGLAHGLLQALDRHGGVVLGLAAGVEAQRRPAVDVGEEGVRGETAAGDEHTAEDFVTDAGRPVDVNGAHAEGAEQAEDRALALPHQDPVLDAADAVHEGDSGGGFPGSRPDGRPLVLLDREVDGDGLLVLVDLDRALVLGRPGVEPHRLHGRRHRAASLSRHPAGRGPIPGSLPLASRARSAAHRACA